MRGWLNCPNPLQTNWWFNMNLKELLETIGEFKSYDTPKGVINEITFYGDFNYLNHVQAHITRHYGIPRRKPERSTKRPGVWMIRYRKRLAQILYWFIENDPVRG